MRFFDTNEIRLTTNRIASFFYFSLGGHGPRHVASANKSSPVRAIATLIYLVIATEKKIDR